MEVDVLLLHENMSTETCECVCSVIQVASESPRALNAGWIHIGRTKRLSTIFMRSYKEPEVVVKCLGIIK